MGYREPLIVTGPTALMLVIKQVRQEKKEFNGLKRSRYHENFAEDDEYIGGRRGVESAVFYAHEAWSLVLEFFNGDEDKTTLWFETVNPLLGGIKPSDILRFDRGSKLLKFIEEQLMENL